MCSSVIQYYSHFIQTDPFHLGCTLEIDIEKILGSTNFCKAAGIDDLSDHFLKDGSRVLSKPISELCNLSIKLETFSNPCKIVKMKPLFKKGFKTQSSSYRPILLLPLISKIIAKLIHEQTSCFYVTMKFYTTTNQDFLKPLDRLIFLLQTYVFA